MGGVNMGLIYFLLVILAIGIVSFLWTINYYRHVDV